MGRREVVADIAALIQEEVPVLIYEIEFQTEFQQTAVLQLQEMLLFKVRLEDLGNDWKAEVPNLGSKLEDCRVPDVVHGPIEEARAHSNAHPSDQLITERHGDLAQLPRQVAPRILNLFIARQNGTRNSKRCSERRERRKHGFRKGGQLGLGQPGNDGSHFLSLVGDPTVPRM